MKFIVLTALVFLFAGISHAQQNNNQYFQEQQRIQNQNHAAEQNRQGYMTQQQQLQQQQQLPLQPTGYWEKTWGAIAGDDQKGILGTAIGVNDESQARRLAIEDCEANGGDACKVHLTYYNQCAAFVTGNNGYSATGAATIDEATAISMQDCKKSDKDCRVYYSACTEPIFHKY